MPLDRVPFQTIKPTWGRPSTHMSIRYAVHPSLRLAFIQTMEDPEYVFVVSDERLPISIPEAIAVIERWRSENGQT